MTTASHPILVIGAGIAGVTSALEAAETGQSVLLIEKEPAIGGRVLRNHHYFPKLCPPSCGMEINAGRLERNHRIKLMVATEVIAAKRSGGIWRVTLRHQAEYVKRTCTECGECTSVCEVRIPDPFNYGMTEVAAIRPYHTDAYPRRFVLERGACRDDCHACVDACPVQAIDLDAKPSEETIEVAAVIVATGWQPYPLENLDELGGGRLPDVIANVHLERMVSASGPAQGKIVRPSDGKEPRRIAFVQCAGSRDVNHLPYCSAVCCLASLKQAAYVKEQYPDADVTIYYIDRRTPGRNEEMLAEAERSEGVRLVKGKVAKVEENGRGGMSLRVEEVESGKVVDADADLVVLATGMMPSVRQGSLPFDLDLDDDSFVLDQWDVGLFGAGVSRRPEDVASSVRDATGAAAKAIAATLRSA
jgi:quinone-modifying oxidoreductase subunit QmoA